ncbi:unnamed protein product [Ectocarpus sp. 12 AP-2014]
MRTPAPSLSCRSLYLKMTWSLLLSTQAELGSFCVLHELYSISTYSLPSFTSHFREQPQQSRFVFGEGGGRTSKGGQLCIM